MEDELGAVDLIRVDSPKDVERLKLIAEELDNDTGREIYLAFYSGLETVSQVAEKLGLTIQLTSYHVEKLVLAGLLREKPEPFFSVKGRAVKRYEPSKAALLIVPSMQHLRANREEAQKVRRSLLETIGRLLPQIVVPAAVFLATLFSPKMFLWARLVVAQLGQLAKSMGKPAGNTSSPTIMGGTQMLSPHLNSTVAAFTASHMVQPFSLGLLLLALALGVSSWLLVRFLWHR